MKSGARRSFSAARRAARSAPIGGDAGRRRRRRRVGRGATRRPGGRPARRAPARRGRATITHRSSRQRPSGLSVPPDEVRQRSRHRRAVPFPTVRSAPRSSVRPYPTAVGAGHPGRTSLWCPGDHDDQPGRTRAERSVGDRVPGVHRCPDGVRDRCRVPGLRSSCAPTSTSTRVASARRSPGPSTSPGWRSVSCSVACSPIDSAAATCWPAVWCSTGWAPCASAVAPGLELLLVARFVWGLGASAPSVLRFAIARDLYDGDRMARVVATFTAVFLIGPIFVPFVGEAILVVGSWRTVFLVGVVLAAVAFVWTLRFGETMAVEHRRPIRFRPFAEAFVVGRADSGDVVGARGLDAVHRVVLRVARQLPADPRRGLRPRQPVHRVLRFVRCRHGASRCCSTTG